MRLFFLLTLMLWALEPQQAVAIGLKEAMQMAVQQHPLLRVSNAQLQGAEGLLEEQAAYAYNPELSLKPQRRRVRGGASFNDYYLSLSQGIELAGKQGLRQRVAEAGVQVSKLTSQMMHQQLMIRAARASVALYFSSQEQLWRSQQTAALLQLSKAVGRQLALGEANLLDVNLANASLAQAMNANVQAKQRHSMNVSRYLVAIGSLEMPVDVSIELPTLSLKSPSLEHAERLAIHSRLGLQIKRQRLAQAAAQTDLAKAQRIPDLKLGLSTGREAGDRLYALEVSMPLPVLNPHEGAYRAALSQFEQQKIELAWLEQRLRLDVRAAIDGYQIALHALANMRQLDTADALAEAIGLATQAFDAGEMDLEGLVIHINQIIESRIQAAAVLQAAWLARIRLAEVLGQATFVFEGTRS